LTETPVPTHAVSIFLFKYKWKSFPTAGSKPQSFQSKREHASLSAMMNPQEMREKNLYLWLTWITNKKKVGICA
jgi:hypothetical protein